MGLILATIVGAALIVAGAALLSPALGLIVAGSVVLAAVYLAGDA